jgi:predicted phage terminase large subunit-like protein
MIMMDIAIMVIVMKDLNKELIKRYAKIELARRDFFAYCNVIAPDFYKPSRQYLVELCNELQRFYEGNDKVLIINLPPRTGKSRTATLFAQWILGKSIENKIMTGSYNETLSTVFSKSVRNTIQETKADDSIVVYSDIFPNVKIKKGDGSMNLWSLEGGYNNYLATSPSGTATGFGCKYLLLDDLVRNAEEAFNETVLDKHWAWFTETMLSRLEEGGKIVIIMTRWATKDLAGRALEFFKGEKLKTIIKKAMNDDGTMLCDELLSKESYFEKVKAMSQEIASANYQQIPVDIKGTLYKNLKTYTDLPKDDNGNILCDCIRAYCDTADTGSDYLCNIIYAEFQKQAYILDVYYTKDPMEITELEVARRLEHFNVNIADIESNNGGRGFSRNVKSKMKSNKCVISWFHQSKNKKARILSSSAWVQENVYFPTNWKDRWNEFFIDVTTYQKEGKNKHDDSVDALAGIYDKINTGRWGW